MIDLKSKYRQNNARNEGNLLFSKINRSCFSKISKVGKQIFALNYLIISNLFILLSGLNISDMMIIFLFDHHACGIN